MSKFALPVAELKPALIGLGKVLTRRSTLPILSHLKIERTKDGWVALTGTDLERCATVRLEQPAEGEPGALLVPYHELQKTVKACAKGDTIHVSSAEGPAVLLQYPIGQQLAAATVPTLPADEFPVTPRIKGEPIPLPDALRASINEAMECSSDDETRYILNSAFIDVSEKKCHHVIGTNGRILYSSNSFSLPLEKSLIIPKHPFLGWKEFNNDGEWQLRIGEKGKDDPAPVQISTRRWRFISKQIDGTYPDWRQVVPGASASETKFEIPADMLASVVQTIQRMPCHCETHFTIGLELSGKTLRLLGKSRAGERWTKVEVPAVRIEGPDAAIFINRRHLATGLKFGLNTVEIVDPMSPMRLSNGGRQLIMMPVRGDAPDPPAASAAEPTPPQEEARVDAPTATCEAQTPGRPESEESAQDDQPANPEPQNEQVAVISTAAPPEERTTTMVNTTTTDGSANGASPDATPAAHQQPPASEIDQVLETIEDIRESLVTNLTDLKTISGKLRQMKRDQRTTERDINSLRQTMKVLQNVKL